MTFSNVFNTDFQDLIREFNSNDVDYLLIGGYLVILNGYNRTTGDLDLWVNPTSQNFNKLNVAFGQFGLPTNLITREEFLNTDKNEVFSFGIPPVSIDILTTVKGLSFDRAYENSQLYQIEKDLLVCGLSKSDLLKAKRAAGRYKDLDDIENLTNG